MNDRLLATAARRGALQARIDQQRQEFQRHFWPLEGALATADRALSGVDWLKQHPAALGAAVAAVVVARPKRVFRWARQGFFLWRGWTSLRKSLVGNR